MSEAININIQSFHIDNKHKDLFSIFASYLSKHGNTYSYVRSNKFYEEDKPYNYGTNVGYNHGYDYGNHGGGTHAVTLRDSGRVSTPMYGGVGSTRYNGVGNYRPSVNESHNNMVFTIFYYDFSNNDSPREPILFVTMEELMKYIDEHKLVATVLDYDLIRNMGVCRIGCNRDTKNLIIRSNYLDLKDAVLAGAKY